MSPTDVPGPLAGQRGLSMLEALVALAILAYASIASLAIYDAMWRSFKKGENAAEQQQAVRIAFDKLVLDLQVSGYNHNPDGDAGRPDEQIEAAFDTAIVLRADLDAQDLVAAATPETVLAGGAFDSVSVGNDEIVAYVLAKPDGSSSGTLSFHADVRESPRDGIVETVNIPNVALIPNDPPYTLYRISLSNSPGDWGSPGFFVREPLAENVLSLTFRYLDATDSPLNTGFDLTTTSDDIGGGEALADRARRNSIRSIELTIVGLTPDPELGWVDPDDSDPDTRAFRKFQLESDVVRRNSGLRGVKDLPPN